MLLAVDSWRPASSASTVRSDGITPPAAKPINRRTTANCAGLVSHDCGSNNAAVTSDGGEIGRAQALQARAARRAPVTAMNPVLLKPEGETGSQVVVRGQRRASLTARQYWADRAQLLPEVSDAFHELAATADIEKTAAALPYFGGWR